MARRKKRGPIQAIFKAKHAYLPGTDVLRQLDVDELADELDVDAQGKLDGEQDVPAADGRTLSMKEREIVGRLREEWDEAIAGVKRAYEGYRSRFASMTAETEIDSLLAQPKAVCVTLLETAREERDRLNWELRDVRQARDALEQFRTHEHLTRPPHEEQSAIKKWFVLFLAAVLEFAINTSIFAGGDEFGFVGAITKVLIIPIVNIGGCWFLAHWLARQVLAYDVGRKVLGAFGCFLVVAWLLALNLAIAHWRDSADALLSLDAAQVTVDSALAHPFQLRSFQSWGLFVIGCAAGIVAIYEGWSWTDPHPGYARRARQTRNAEESWLDSRAAAIDRLVTIKDQSCASLEKAQRDAEVAQTERPNIAARVESLRDDVSLFADHLANVCDELGARYREANLRARSTEGPAQFDKPLTISLELPSLPPLTLGPKRRQIPGRLATAINQITTGYADACRSIPSMVELEDENSKA